MLSKAGLELARELARTVRVRSTHGLVRPFARAGRKASKPVRSCNPRLGRFDSCAAPLT